VIDNEGRNGADHGGFMPDYIARLRPSARRCFS
jgi:hypothetical protein